ncbi:hypothetical protein FGB62_132g029 [Gracilaria domingensis]|nr:hypothetical protein FGB62_132g029 [Gracilaria domingensis]
MACTTLRPRDVRLVYCDHLRELNVHDKRLRAAAPRASALLREGPHGAAARGRRPLRRNRGGGGDREGAHCGEGAHNGNGDGDGARRGYADGGNGRDDDGVFESNGDGVHGGEEQGRRERRTVRGSVKLGENEERVDEKEISAAQESEAPFLAQRLRLLERKLVSSDDDIELQ